MKSFKKYHSSETLSPTLLRMQRNLSSMVHFGSSGACPSKAQINKKTVARERDYSYNQSNNNQSTTPNPPCSPSSNQYGEDRVVEEWIHNLKQSKYHFEEAIFVLGPMGAGKSTVVEQEFKKHHIYKNYAYVDTDELMEKLDGFDSKRTGEFYPIARSIAIRLTDWLLDENISFIAEGTCVKYLELEDYMYRLKRKGYVIKVRHVNSISLEEILQRTAHRERRIPDSVVQSIYHGSLRGVNELMKLNKDGSLFEQL
eukprot:gene14189-15668_t